jgi:hypothetical protein
MAGANIYKFEETRMKSKTLKFAMTLSLLLGSTALYAADGKPAAPGFAN